MTGDDRMCAILPMFHIFGLTAALLASAISGASLILPQSVKSDELLRVISGENIMPDEVASAISAHDSIADVKVIGVPDESYGEAVSAAIVLKEGAAFDEKGMREFLMTRLAKYKIPSYYFVYEKLPALANGKVDAVSLKKELIAKIST